MELAFLNYKLFTTNKCINAPLLSIIDDSICNGLALAQLVDIVFIVPIARFTGDNSGTARAKFFAKLEQRPNNKFKKLSNCNLILTELKALGISMVGIGSVDILEGISKIIAGIIMQFIRYDITVNFNCKKNSLNMMPPTGVPQRWEGFSAPLIVEYLAHLSPSSTPINFGLSIYSIVQLLKRVLPGCEFKFIKYQHLYTACPQILSQSAWLQQNQKNDTKVTATTSVTQLNDLLQEINTLGADHCEIPPLLVFDKDKLQMQQISEDKQLPIDELQSMLEQCVTCYLGYLIQFYRFKREPINWITCNYAINMYKSCTSGKLTNTSIITVGK